MTRAALFRSDRSRRDDDERGKGGNGGWPGAMITVRSPAAAADAFPNGKRENTGSGRSTSGAGIVGARNWAGAVAAHSRSAGAGGGGIRGAVADSVTPQLLQKFAPSRFSVLQIGQIKAMAYLLTTLGIQNGNLPLAWPAFRRLAARRRGLRSLQRAWSGAPCVWRSPRRAPSQSPAPCWAAGSTSPRSGSP